MPVTDIKITKTNKKCPCCGSFYTNFTPPADKAYLKCLGCGNLPDQTSLFSFLKTKDGTTCAIIINDK